MKNILVLILMLPFVFKAQKTMESKTLTPKNEIVYENKAKQKAYTKIQGLRKQVINGTSIKTLAALYSDDPGSAKEGGLIQNIAKGMMVPAFEKVLFSLKLNQISEVFETEYGFHFIVLVAQNGSLVDCRHILIMPK
jgi:peptidyl-prolyl cis-trans isomerase SurA